MTAIDALGAAERIERNVMLALQPALPIPIGLAMTDEPDVALRSIAGVRRIMWR